MPAHLLIPLGKKHTCLPPPICIATRASGCQVSRVDPSRPHIADVNGTLCLAMTRAIRVEYEGAVYHVTARGNERCAIFRDHEDRQEYLDTLAERADRFTLLVHIDCLLLLACAKNIVACPRLICRPRPRVSSVKS